MIIKIQRYSVFTPYQKDIHNIPKRYSHYTNKKIAIKNSQRCGFFDEINLKPMAVADAIMNLKLPYARIRGINTGIHISHHTNEKKGAAFELTESMT